MTSLTHIRAQMSSYPLFVANASGPSSNSGSTLPKLAGHGNILAGAVTRVSVGFLLNPFSVLKARYEVRLFRVLDAKYAFDAFAIQEQYV